MRTQGIPGRRNADEARAGAGSAHGSPVSVASRPLGEPEAKVRTIVTVLARSARAGSFATLLLVATAGAASAADGVDAVPAADAAVVDPIVEEAAEPIVGRVEGASDQGAATVRETAQGAKTTVDPIVRSAPAPKDAVATVDRLAGADAPDIVPPDIQPPVAPPFALPVAPPTADPDRVPNTLVAGGRGIAGRDIRDLAPNGGATVGLSSTAPNPSETPSTATAEAGPSSRAAVPPIDPGEGDLSTASALLLVLTLGLVGSCRPAIVSGAGLRLLVRIRMPGSIALLPAVPPG